MDVADQTLQPKGRSGETGGVWERREAPAVQAAPAATALFPLVLARVAAAPHRVLLRGRGHVRTECPAAPLFTALDHVWRIRSYRGIEFDQIAVGAIGAALFGEFKAAAPRLRHVPRGYRGEGENKADATGCRPHAEQHKEKEDCGRHARAPRPASAVVWLWCGGDQRTAERDSDFDDDD